VLRSSNLCNTFFESVLRASNLCYALRICVTFFEVVLILSSVLLSSVLLSNLLCYFLLCSHVNHPPPYVNHVSSSAKNVTSRTIRSFPPRPLLVLNFFCLLLGFGLRFLCIFLSLCFPGVSSGLQWFPVFPVDS
jgi:hypothetical protein